MPERFVGTSKFREIRSLRQYAPATSPIQYIKPDPAHHVAVATPRLEHDRDSPEVQMRSKQRNGRVAAAAAANDPERNVAVI